MQTANARTQKLIAVGAIVALALLSAQAYALVSTGALSSTVIHNASGSTDPATNSTISVTGSGQVDIQPTMAMLTIGVNTQNASAQSAAQQNAQIMSWVISALENLGISAGNITTVSYNVYQQQSYPVVGAPCTGTSGTATCKSNNYYQVENEVQVTISLPSTSVSSLGAKVGQAIDAAVSAGANQVYGVQFSATRAAEQAAQQQALQLAVKDAQSQATAIATALNVSITGVISVTSSPGYYPGGPVVDAVGASSTPIQAPQSLTVSASIQAVYAIS